MVLLDAIVQIGALSDSDRLQFALRLMLKPVRRITGQDGFSIGLTTIDHDPLGPAVPLESLAQKLLGGRQITPLAEPELDRVTMAVDGAVEIQWGGRPSGSA
jgi:hypothetical protein